MEWVRLRQQPDVQRMQRTREIDDAGLVGHGQQGGQTGHGRAREMGGTEIDDGRARPRWAAPT